MKVLISGFGPFGNIPVNPTALLVEDLLTGKIEIPPCLQVRAVVLPVTFRDAFADLDHELRSFGPDVILCFGLAARRGTVDFERVAINCLDAEIEDNWGERPRDLPITESGSPAYFSSLPFRTMEAALLRAKIPAQVSNSAGAFVCNYLFYKVMESIHGSGKRGGFIHVPPLSVLPQEELRKAVSLILQTL